MLLSETDWSQKDTQLALKEGWMVFDDCEIQRDDEAELFASDDDALEHVRQRAAQGSRTHQVAIAVHDANA